MAKNKKKTAKNGNASRRDTFLDRGFFDHDHNLVMSETSGPGAVVEVSEKQVRRQRLGRRATHTIVERTHSCPSCGEVIQAETEEYFGPKI